MRGDCHQRALDEPLVWDLGVRSKNTVSVDMVFETLPVDRSSLGGDRQSHLCLRTSPASWEFKNMTAVAAPGKTTIMREYSAPTLARVRWRDAPYYGVINEPQNIIDKMRGT